MCCRYYFGEETSEFIRSVTSCVDEPAVLMTGDIHPSDLAAVITGRTSDLRAEYMRWGFPSSASKQLMINARTETVWEKSSFSSSIRSRRCVIAAERFYEWDRQKNRVSFTVPGRQIVCMAGIWNRFDDEDRFMVLTTAANASMLPIHDRMPVILREEILRDWVYNADAAREILKESQPLLQKQQEYEQLSLF